MFSKREMAQYSSMVIEDGNHELVEFYQKNFDFFTKCSATDFENSAEVLNKLAIILHNSLDFRHNWKIYASQMGISDNMTIAIIDESAKVREEMPLYVTMTRALNHINGKLSNIIKALLNIPRYDALEYLRPHVQKLLEKSNTPGKSEPISNKRMPCLEKKYEDISLFPSRKLVKHFPLAVKSEFSTNPPKREVESLQQKNIKNCVMSESKSLPCLDSSEQNCDELPVQEVHFLPSAPMEDQLSVFIQHTEHDADVARELSTRMRKLGIVVKTSYEVEMLHIMDCAGALSTILQEVDFIVPVVSEQFFQQIHPHMCDKFLESTDALINRTLYQLINTQYQSNRCVNFKVRSVLLPDVDRRRLNSDVVLFYGLRLWEEFPKLIRILKETKDLIAQYPFY